MMMLTFPNKGSDYIEFLMNLHEWHISFLVGLIGWDLSLEVVTMASTRLQIALIQHLNFLFTTKTLRNFASLWPLVDVGNNPQKTRE